MAVKLNKTNSGLAPRGITWDRDLKGLGLRVSANGRRVFVLNYRTQAGTQRRVNLGAFPAISADEARRMAKGLLADVAHGGDPATERRRVRASPTFSQMSEWYLADHARPRLKTAREIERTLRRVLIPRWGSRKAETITRREVAALHQELGKAGPYSANRTLALISAMFSKAERCGLLPENHPNPARRVERFPERDRERWLSEEEVARMVRALEAEASVFVRGFFWLALLTGLRKRELLTLTWEQVDLVGGTIHLPDTKAGRSHRIPLSPRALDVLCFLPREQGCPFVFAGRAPGSNLSVSAIDQAWRRIRGAARADDARVHDLRRTVGSWMAQHGASLSLIGAVLNHSTPATTAVYARMADAGVRAALDQHADRVISVASSAESEDTGAPCAQ